MVLGFINYRNNPNKRKNEQKNSEIVFLPEALTKKIKMEEKEKEVKTEETEIKQETDILEVIRI